MFCLVVLLLASVAQGENRTRDVATDQGVVRGYTADAKDVFSFYGIPYATAPTGENRFKAALPPPKWNGIFNATERNIACPQTDDFEYEVTITTDCLRVNVFVPDVPKSNHPLPVVVYLHGGVHQCSFANRYSPINLVKRGLIYVNFGFRLGALGFLCLNTEYAPGNAGLKDQVEAMKWVKRNIANFGGNPDHITIDGSSSGSFCVELQIFSSMSNGLFSQAILISGSTLSKDGVRHDQLKIASAFAEQLGETIAEDVEQLERFYRNLTEEQLSIRFKLGPKFIGFTPCVETHNVFGVNKFLTEYPIDTIINGNYKKLRYMSGFTDMDGLDFLGFYDSFEPVMKANFRDILPGDIPFESEEKAVETTRMIKDFYFPTGEINMERYVDFFTDSVFIYPQYASARLHAKNGEDVYLYRFSYNGTVNLPSVFNLPIWGPGHVTPLLYLQRQLESFIYDNMSPEEFIIQDKLSDLYYHFVKDGVPWSSKVNTTWLPVSAHGEHLHIVNEVVFQMEEYPFRERMRLWEKVYKYPYETDLVASSAISITAKMLFVLLLTIF